MIQKQQTVSHQLTKVLIIRLSSFGDIVQCTGAPRILKKSLGSRTIVHWLIRSDNQELIKLNPHINKVISFDRKLGFKGWLQLCQDLKKENYTHIYDAHNNIRSHILTFIVKAPQFVRRSKNRFRRFLLFTFKINTFGRHYSAARSYLAPLSKWNVADDNENSEVHLSHELKVKLLDLIPQTGKKWIALAPATAWKKKTWPLESWKSLLQSLLNSTDFRFIILGGPNDSFCNDLILDPSRVLSLQGKLSLLESATAVSLCETLIAADTGILHLAEALKKDVIAIVGPTPFGDPSRSTSTTLKTNLWCQPCSKDGRGLCINPTFQKCMKAITPEMVFESLKQHVTR